jgi:O-antigen/teichoic acid export membrane protein
MVFIYPYFAAHNTDFNWIKKYSIKLFQGLACVNALISIVLCVGAPLIIHLFWGEKYMDSVAPFRILSISYFFLATFRVPAGNILAMLRKVKVNLLVSIISGIANVVFCYVFIRAWGSIGAALATLVVVVISSLIAFPYLLHHIKKNLKPVDENTK